MTVCFCIDDGMGISFNARRQSKDKTLIARLCSLAEGKRILIKKYSAKLFDTTAASVAARDSFDSATDGDLLFVECEDPTKYMEKADCVIIYRWNRQYPSDIKLSAYPDSLGFQLEGSLDFVGNSHEKITEEIWKR